VKIEDIINQIRIKKSLLCVGLDTDRRKIPVSLLKLDDPVYEFNKMIIDATKDIAIAYKINTAFYEAEGINGLRSMEKTLNYIPSNIFKIADAKRGDIGNTSLQYARAFFDTFCFDAITVAPYMGRDSIEPFLSYKDKTVIILALTSNNGAKDFQLLEFSGRPLYIEVIEKSKKWGENIMYVVGATKAKELKEIRNIIPDNFILVPGIGAQGGNMEEVLLNGLNKNFGLIINVSRSVIYASEGGDFAKKAYEEALKIRNSMNKYINY